MKWQSMKTAPKSGRIVWVTLQYSDGTSVVYPDWFPFCSTAIAWTDTLLKPPTPYTGTIEDLNVDGA